MTEGELEAFYRFVGNERVTPDAILAPHVKATIDRMQAHEMVLVVHDTTEFSFGGKRDDLLHGSKGASHFKGHFSLAVSGDGMRTPLGVLNIDSFVRNEETPTKLRKKGVPYKEVLRMPSEQDRWAECVDVVATRAGQSNSLLHP